MRERPKKPQRGQPGLMSWGCLLLVALFLGTVAPVADARWEEMDDAAMDQVVAEAGISIEFTTLGYRAVTENLRLTDTDTGNALELKDLMIHDGNGNPFTLRTAGEAITIDVLGAGDPANPAQGSATVSIEMPLLEQRKSVTVGRIVFCGQELGRLDIGNISMPQSHWYLSGHGGLDMEFGLKYKVDHLDYMYNEAPVPGHLDFNGIHLAEDFTANPTDDPADPSTWNPAGTFRIGDMLGGQPATLDVDGQGAGGPGYLSLNLPVQGSIRVENIHFGSSQFGPCAIDGIRVHRLTVQLPAN
jgi:hypothetical protein